MSPERLKICKKSENFAFAMQFVDNNKGNVGLSLEVPRALEFGLNGEILIFENLVKNCLCHW